MSNQTNLTLTSTIVSPFKAAKSFILPLTADEFRSLCGLVTQNFCGHPATIAAIEAAGVKVPPKTEGFWSMDGIGIAARPKGGVRGANGDVPVDALETLEFAAFVHLDPNSKDELFDFKSQLDELTK